MHEIRTGRALQLEGLQFAQNKVTLGFKCEAGTKIQLAHEAEQTGMTLSEYVDTVISSRHLQNKQSQGQDTIELLAKLETHRKQIQQLEGKVNFYENDFLKRAFSKYKGQTITTKNRQGREIDIEINSIEDVFTIFLNSVNII